MKVIIIGGSHAGIACALETKVNFPEAEVIIYEKDDTIGFIAQSIPLYLSEKQDFLKMSSYIAAQDLEEQGIVVKLNTLVRKVDIEKKEISYFPVGSRTLETDTYDKLVLATGSYPALPLAIGNFRENVYLVKNLQDAEKIKKTMETATKFVVIGIGAIGVEVSRILNQKNIHVTAIHSGESVLSKYLDVEVGSTITADLIKEGIDVHTSTIVTSIEEIEVAGKRKVIVTTKDEKVFEADGAIYAAGFRPNSFLLQQQVKLGDKKAILVDGYMQTSVPDVFAIGDCSTTNVTNAREPIYMPHASDAIRQGEIAALNLKEPTREINHSQGTYNMNFDEHILCMTGLSKQRAIMEGFDCGLAYCENKYLTSDKGYRIWVAYEKDTHKILGFIARGTSAEVHSYADIISLAIEQNLTIEDLEYTDFYFKHGYKDPRSFTKILAEIIRKQDPKKE